MGEVGRGVQVFRPVKRKHQKFVNKKLVPSESDRERNKWMLNKAYEFAEDLRSKATPSEVELRSIFNKKGLKYIEEWVVIIPEYGERNYKIKTFYIGDFYLPDYNLIIEVDGEYHFNELKSKKDFCRDRTLSRYSKHNVLRLENRHVPHFIKNIDDVLLRVGRSAANLQPGSKKKNGERFTYMDDGSISKIRFKRGRRPSEYKDSYHPSDAQENGIKAFLAERNRVVWGQ